MKDLGVNGANEKELSQLHKEFILEMCIHIYVDIYVGIHDMRS